MELASPTPGSPARETRSPQTENTGLFRGLLPWRGNHPQPDDAATVQRAEDDYDEDAPRDDAATVQRVEEILGRASELAADGHRDRAREQLEEMQRLAPAAGGDADGVQRLAELLVQVVEMERARHEQEMPFAGAPPASPRVGDPTSPPEGSPRVASQPLLPLGSPRAGSRSPGPGGQPCGEGGAAADRERAQRLWERLKDLSILQHGAMGGPIVNACKGAMALVAGTFNLSCNVQRQLFAGVDRFVFPQRVASRLREVKLDAETAAVEHCLLGAQLRRLAVEAELQEALLAAEYKANLLKGGDAFSEMCRVQRLLASFLDAAPSRPGLQGSFAASAADLAALAAHAQTSEFQAAASEGDRTHRARGSWDGPRPQAPRAKTRAAGGALRDGTCRAACSAGAAAPHGPPNGAARSRLERWYEWFFLHCVGKLELLFHGGLTAARRLGPDKVAGPPGPASGTLRAGAGAEVPGDGGGGFRRAREQVPHGVPECTYLSDLRALACLPGVLFAGVFANAQQLPHLQSWLDPAWLFDPGCGRPHRAVPPRRGGGAGAGASGAGAAASGAGADCDWWALSFSAASGAAPSGAVEARATSSAGGAEAAPPPPLDGAAAYERWRHEPELRQLRTELGKACQKRHMKRGERDRAEAPASDLQKPARSLSRSPPEAAGGPASFQQQEQQHERGRTRDPFSSQSPAAQKRRASPERDAPHERGARHVLDAAAARHSPSASPRAAPSGAQALPPDFELLPPSAMPNTVFGEPSSDVLQCRPIDLVLQCSPPQVHQLAEQPAAYRPFHCLVVPLDIGWFPAPLFLGVAVRPPPFRSRAGTAASQQSSSPTAPGDARRGVPADHPVERECFLWRIFRWLRFAPLGPAALAAGAPRPGEFTMQDLERELTSFAANASGRALRGGLPAGAPPRA